MSHADGRARGACPVCGADRAARVFRRSRVPALQNRVYPTAAEAERCVVGVLDVVCCRACGFLWNRAFDGRRLAYDPAYENDQTQSPGFQDHLDGVIDRVLGAAGLPAALDVLEVGCGQGTFLRRLAARVGGRLRSAVGFDPAWRGSASEPPPVRLVARAFDEDAARSLDPRPNLVISRHTIEHLPDPCSFLRALRRSLADDGASRVFVETPGSEWILRAAACQDLFHEHCSLFSAEGLAQAMAREGLVAARVAPTFGGQYLLAEAAPGAPSAVGGGPGAAVRALVPGFRRRARRFIEGWRARVVEAAQAGPVGLWGAGAKGVTFATLVDPDRDTLDCAVDINPAKQGRFLPLAGLPVVAPAEAARRGLATVIVMNPNYLGEVEGACAGWPDRPRLVPVR